MILYIGNILSIHGGSIGFIETLAPKLAGRYSIKAVSSFHSKPLRLLHMIFSVFRYRKVCTVVLVDVFSTQAFWFAYIIGKVCVFLGIPYVTVVRGGDFPKRLGSSKAACYDLFMKSKMNIVPSKFLEHHFLLANFEVRYIPNFIELEKYAFKERREVRPRILWVRAFHQIYNPLMAIETMDKLGADAALCMVGSDSDGTRQNVEHRITELNLGKNVVLTGRLLKEDWIRLSLQYDIFINTTTIDNMPVSVIEAMALGMPVVSTNVGGIPYLLENGADGILVPSNSAEEMAKAIRELTNNPKKAHEISRQARKKVEAFDWDSVKLKWFEILDPLVSSR